MRNFDASVVTELEAEVAKAIWLCEMRFGNTWRYNNSDIDLYLDGFKFSKFPFDIVNIDQSRGFSIDAVTLEFSSVSLEFSYILLNEDIVNKKVIVYCMLLDSDNVEVGTPRFFEGFVSEWSISEQRAEITLVSKFILWRKSTLRIPTESCPWAFKSMDMNLIKDPSFTDSTYWTLTDTYATIDTSGTYSEDSEIVLRLVANNGTYVTAEAQKSLSKFGVLANDNIRVKLRAYLSADLDSDFYVQFTCYDSGGSPVQYPTSGAIGTADGSWQDIEAVITITDDSDIVAMLPELIIKNDATAGEVRVNHFTCGPTSCGYDGTEIWCDQSWERCTELSNTDNFGGRKYILSLENKQVFWGPRDKKE